MASRVQRKPIVYLLVILPIIVGGELSLVLGLLETYSRIKGVARSSVPDLNGFLITLPSLFLWIPISLLIGNIVLYCVPPLRRIAEGYAARTGRPDFLASQKALLRVIAVLALVCIPLIVLGFLL